MTTALFCTIVAITNAMGGVAVDTHGARVVSSSSCATRDSMRGPALKDERR